MNVLFNKKLEKYWIDDELFLLFFSSFLEFLCSLLSFWWVGINFLIPYTLLVKLLNLYLIN
jgi:hypothetical protein